jgi:hypothetical protein
MKETETHNEVHSEVELKQLTLGQLLGLSRNPSGHCLKIPEYQRIYCWEEKHVLRLLADINIRNNRDYHLGTIILHKHASGYDIVDGQQRLVTLSLLLLALDKEQDFDLLNEAFSNKEAQDYIAYNKWLIENYLKKPHHINPNTLYDHLSFSVLILNSDNLDLAYTFFTAENGKGKSLTDYDLLKSHHLRYVYIAAQAEHLAARWDDMIRNSHDDEKNQPLARCLGLYLFRLRKWMRKRNWNEDEKRKIKNHFEAAPIIPDIPAFGEQFRYYETIQGGAHFFAFAEYFVHRFELFSQLELYKQLQNRLSGEKHWWYRDVIGALVFAYYLKFGQQYILQAFHYITDWVSNHRYSTARVYLSSLLEYVSNSEIVMMIDQSTSPTFFLAEIKMKVDMISMTSQIEEPSGTRKRYHKYIQEIKSNLKIQ